MVTLNTVSTVAGTVGFPMILTLNYPLKGLGGETTQLTNTYSKVMNLSPFFKLNHISENFLPN